MPKVTILEGNSKDKDKIRVFMVKGEKGDTGDTGNGIASVEKTATVGNIDTYTITFTNGATYSFDVANGEGATVIVDNLTDTSTNKALSANQGRVLKGLVDGLDSDKVNVTDIVDDLTSTDTDKPLSANQGKFLKDTIDAIPITIKELTEDIYLVDGQNPTLETGFYVSGNYGIYVNGVLEQQLVRSLFFYDSYYPMFSLIHSFDGEYSIFYNLTTDNLGAWTNDLQMEVDYTNTLQNSNKLVPTSQAVYNALQNLIDYSGNEKIIGTWRNGKPLYRKFMRVELPEVVTEGTQVIAKYLIANNADYGFISEAWLEASPELIPELTFMLPYISNNNSKHIRPYITTESSVLKLAISSDTKDYNNSGSGADIGMVCAIVCYTKSTD